jgi:hypothetical protein
MANISNNDSIHFSLWNQLGIAEDKLDTLIDFTIALMEDEVSQDEGDAIFHANILGLQLGFTEAQTQHILGTIVKNYSQSLMFERG